MIDDPTILIIVGASALAVAGLNFWLAYLGWRAWRRHVAHRHNAMAFLAELKTEAAWAEVSGFPYEGADIINMMATRGLVDQRETDALMAAADARHEAEFGVRSQHAYFERSAHGPAAAPAMCAKPAFSKLVDDEIPF